MTVEIGRLAIQHDRDYGIDHRRGWSICWDGHYIVELERYLCVALWRVSQDNG